MIIVVVLAQILAIGVHTYLLSLVKKYCGHCDWWCNAGAVMFIVISLIPILGLFSSIAGCADHARHIIKELTKREV